MAGQDRDGVPRHGKARKGPAGGYAFPSDAAKALRRDALVRGRRRQGAFAQAAQFAGLEPGRRRARDVEWCRPPQPERSTTAAARHPMCMILRTGEQRTCPRKHSQLFPSPS